MLGTVRFLTSHPLTRDARLAAFFRFAQWQIRSRLSKTVSVPWVQGTRLVLERGMSGATGNIYAGLHEFADMFFLLHLLRPDDLFCDVGANVGSYTVLASGVCGSKTVAFEADPDTANNLRRNIAANSLENLVEVCAVAAGPCEGEVRLTLGHDAMNRVASGQTEGTRSVRQSSLDILLEDRRPLFMKLDVEGYEEQVLAGADAVLANESLVAIETEGFTASVQARLEKHGFVRRFYDPYTRALSLVDVGHRPSNVLMIRNLDLVSSRLKSASKVAVLNTLL